MSLIASRGIGFFFLNFGHVYYHLFMMLFPTVVLGLEREFNRPYSELLPLSLPGFIAFVAGTLPAGWLGDSWSRFGLIAVFSPVSAPRRSAPVLPAHPLNLPAGSL